MTNDTWMTWGAELRRLREEADKTQAQLARGSRIARSTLSAMESGGRAPRRRQAEALDTVLETGGLLTRLWEEATKRVDMPEWWKNALLLEQRCREIWEYEPHIIPGLLQTAEYAQTIIRSGLPHASEEKIEELVQQRIGRLAALEERSEGMPVLRFILGQRALEPPGVPEDVMVGQIDRLLGLMSNGKIELRVIATEATPISAQFPFRLVTMEKGERAAHLEHFDGGVTKDDPDLLATLATTFGTLAMESLPARESIALINGVRARWNGASPATAADTKGTASK